jgi:uncharacterized caspase-like protein
MRRRTTCFFAAPAELVGRLGNCRRFSVRRLGFLVFALSAFIAQTEAAAPVAPSAARFALIIGNADYASVGILKNPANDARDMCKALGGLGFKTACYFDVKTRVQLRSLIQDFVETLPDGAVSFVYYAGHAIQINGENYLIPTGAQLKSASALITESVGVAYLMKELRRNQDFLNVVILDACRNNPLAAATGTPNQGLAQVTDVPDGTMVLYATAADELALDGKGRNGIMTKNILANIREPGTIDDLFKQVSLGVQKDTSNIGRPQKPALYTNFAGQYCLVKCTDLEQLQRQRDLAADQLADLQARVASGDQEAKAKLDAAMANLQKLAAETKAAAQKEARTKQNNAFVPPTF